MPSVPSRVPAQPRLLRASPPGRAASMTATMMGMVETRSEAMPEATMVSAQVSRMLFALMNRMPTRARRQSCWRETRRLRPVVRQRVTRRSVVSRVRHAATSDGARCRPARWIAV